MKTELIVFALLLSIEGVAADESRDVTGTVALHDSFHFAPLAPIDSTLLAATSPVVVLDTLTVTQSIWRRSLQQQIENTWANAEAEKFMWHKGGLLYSRKYGKLQADYGTWVELGDRTLGINPSREIFVKVDLIRLRW